MEDNYMKKLMALILPLAMTLSCASVLAYANENGQIPDAVIAEQIASDNSVFEQSASEDNPITDNPADNTEDNVADIGDSAIGDNTQAVEPWAANPFDFGIMAEGSEQGTNTSLLLEIGDVFSGLVQSAPQNVIGGGEFEFTATLSEAKNLTNSAYIGIKSIAGNTGQLSDLPNGTVVTVTYAEIDGAPIELNADRVSKTVENGVFNGNDGVTLYFGMGGIDSFAGAKPEIFTTVKVRVSVAVAGVIDPQPPVSDTYRVEYNLNLDNLEYANHLNNEMTLVDTTDESKKFYLTRNENSCVYVGEGIPAGAYNVLENGVKVNTVTVDNENTVFSYDKTFVVVFKNADGAVLSSSVFHADAEVTMPAALEVPDGKVFAGWTDGNTAYEAEMAYSISSSVTLVPKLDEVSVGNFAPVNFSVWAGNGDQIDVAENITQYGKYSVSVSGNKNWPDLFLLKAYEPDSKNGDGNQSAIPAGTVIRVSNLYINEGAVGFNTGNSYYDYTVGEDQKIAIEFWVFGNQLLQDGFTLADGMNTFEFDFEIMPEYKEPDSDTEIIFVSEQEKAETGWFGYGINWESPLLGDLKEAIQVGGAVIEVTADAKVSQILLMEGDGWVSSGVDSVEEAGGKVISKFNAEKVVENFLAKRDWHNNDELLAGDHLSVSRIFNIAFDAEADGTVIYSVKVRVPEGSAKASGFDSNGNVLGSSLAGKNATLGGNIEMNFYMSLSRDVLDNGSGYMEFEINGRTSTVAINPEKTMKLTIDYADQDQTYSCVKTYYGFSCPVTASEMTDVISARFCIVKNGEVIKSEPYTTTVAEYSNTILSGNYADTTKNIVKAMLNYGAKAQTYFNHNTDNLADASFAGGYKAVKIPSYVKVPTVNSVTIGSLTYTSATLLTGSNTSVRYYFTLANGASADGYTFTVKTDNTSVNLELQRTEDGRYYVQKDDIASVNLGVAYTLTVSDGLKSKDITYCPMYYAYRMNSKTGSSKALKDLVNALYNYWKVSESGGQDVVEKIPMSEITIINQCPEGLRQKRSGVTYAKDWREYTDGRNELEGGESYYSSVCNQNLPLNVVLPQGYDDPANKDKKYPVLYVLHGFWGHRYSMMVDEPCDIIISNMIDDGTAEEMIVVYPYMFAFNDPNRKEAGGLADSYTIECYDRFVQVIAQDLMPYMADNYRVAEGRENTAVFGFSMGGRESLAIGFTHPDKFGYVAASCPAPGLIPNGTHVPQFDNSSKLVFPEGKEPYILLIGAADGDGMVGATPRDYHNVLDTNKVEHIYYDVQNSWHGGPANWSVCYNFVKNIFKNN